MTKYREPISSGSAGSGTVLSVGTCFVLTCCSLSYAVETWDPNGRAAAVVSEGSCNNLLESSQVREVFSVLLKRSDLLMLVRHYQLVGQQVAGVDTAFDPNDYNLTSKSNKEALRGHCGAMVWFLQRRFGGKAVLKQFVAQNGLEMWHMHLSEVPYRKDNGSIGFLDIDATKTQFGKMKDDLMPLGNELIYEGQVYTHTSEHVFDPDYRWDQDSINPPRHQMELFAVRLETSGQVWNIDF